MHKLFHLSLYLLLLGFFSCQPEKPNQEVVTKSAPNIVLILSDDQAWNDYGFMGHEIVKTPNLDRLASEGILFPRGYVPTAVCRPSLMTLATGLYPHEHRITGNDPAGGWKTPKYPREDLLENVDRLQTLPQILEANGYLSHQSGKWWEGDYKRGGFSYGMTKGQRHGDDGLTIGREGMDTVFNFMDFAVKEKKPFYLWYAPFLPHSPHNPPQRLLDKYTEMDLTESQAKYYAMVEWFDETCGDLINYLDEKGLRENTLIYYVCDNGWIQNPESSKFDVGSKQSAMDGGVRTPIILSWPGVLKPERREELISSVDLMPTILDAAGIETDQEMSGMNLWPNLIGKDTTHRNIVFGEGFGHDIVDKDNPEASLGYRWCVEGDWKLILCYDGQIEGLGMYTHEEMRKEPVRLYKITEDPFETNNLYQDYPEIVKRLKTKIDNWYPLKERKLLGTL
ncbi:sulfatase family protein [Flexithrix dorotheae]|uniref:sulfatase family protein n=1 Tax=Flexithrix dorotheae TaxID=70993 RepID=UPI0003801648|nr:sulfatase [Flexithrix dorotheae]